MIDIPGILFLGSFVVVAITCIFSIAVGASHLSNNGDTAASSPCTLAVHPEGEPSNDKNASAPITVTNSLALWMIVSGAMNLVAIAIFFTFPIVAILFSPPTIQIGAIIGLQLLIELSLQSKDKKDNKDCASESPLLYYGGMTSVVVFGVLGLVFLIMASMAYFSGEL